MKARKQSPPERTIKFIIIPVVIVALSASASLSGTPHLVPKKRDSDTSSGIGGIKKTGAIKGGRGERRAAKRYGVAVSERGGRGRQIESFDEAASRSWNY